MPYLGLTPFLPTEAVIKYGRHFGVNALPRAYSISTAEAISYVFVQVLVSMPYLGLTPFLRYPLETLCLCGFPDPFLQVIHRIFWKLAFFGHFFGLSAFIVSLHQLSTELSLFSICINYILLNGKSQSLSCIFCKYEWSECEILFRKIVTTFFYVVDPIIRQQLPGSLTVE